MSIRRKATVQPYDGLQRYLVCLELDRSYLVDLSEYSGNGFCGCEDFQFRCSPLLREGERSESTRCKHIRAALYFLGDLTNKRLTISQRIETWKKNRGRKTHNPMDDQDAGLSRPYPQGGARQWKSIGPG